MPDVDPQGESSRELDELRKSLEQLRHRYRGLFRNAPVMVVITGNRAGVPIVRDCNGLFLKTVEYRREEVIGRPLSDFYAPASRTELLQGGGYQQALRGEFSAQERQLVTKTGAVVETLLRATPDVDADGKVLGTLAIYVDITERKLAEEALRRSEEKYRSLFEGSQDAIFISTLAGRLLDINPAGVELFGYDSKAELLEVDIDKALYWDPLARKRGVDLLLEQGYVKDLELHLRRKDGSKVVVLETATAVRDETGAVVALRGILRDVTQQRELEAQLRQALQMEVLGQLAGGVAHDFNNLLTAMTGFVDLALMKCGPHDRVAADLREIGKAAARAAALVRQLLAFSRQQVLQPVVMDLNAVVADVEKLLWRTIGEDVELVIELDPDLGRVLADPGQIEQVLMNLAVNARDAMAAGGCLTIASDNVELDESLPHHRLGMEPGSYVRLAVSDTGCGMDAVTRSRIFEPFFTTKELGTGLGLSSAYGIVQQSGGDIYVRSEPGQGTVFEIYLPRVEKASRARRVPRPRPKPAVSFEGSETILLVEDDKRVADLVRLILTGCGYQVLLAQHPRDALTICEQRAEPIDLLLTDLVLPAMNGMELALRVSELCPGVKVLAMSGYTDKAADWDSQVPFLEKPFSPEALGRKVREVLDLERA